MARKIYIKKEKSEYTLRAAAAEFYKHNKIKGLATATQDIYKVYINTFITWYGESSLISDITEEDIESFILYKQDKGVKMVSIATHMNHLRRFFKFCHEKGFCSEIDVLIPKYETELKEPYTIDEMESLLERPKSNRWVEWRTWAMINYFFSTGQRLSTVSPNTSS